ncbi:MAG: amino acid adenylation domain-containing protein, partial [Phaeodactylibacter sp.]|nr:amino acid adenylation domain-containing protein [Phaeodactylibacter sp.]
VGELYLGISAGAMMVIASRETLLSTGAFLELMHRHHITIADVTPSYLAVLDEEALANVRMLITAGEAAVSKDVKKYSSRLQYVNIYGPTETTVVVCSFKIPASYEIGQSVPIGRPVPNMEILIVDEHLQLVPIGVPGEIAVSGVGLARGYLNNDALTAKKFVAHPMKEGERLYRTGDQGRWLDDGNIEFLGRVDHQLKIRGYRVEPGEIEEALMQHPAVQSCVVVGKDIEGRKELIAYLAAKEGEKTAIPALRNFLSETLPDYMVPAYFVELEALPLTSHDKVDREALPEPDLADMPTGTDYAAPRNDMERLLAQTWAEVLRRPRIGIHDNFFHIGGDSIKALQISGRLGAQGWAVSIKGLFTQPTIAQLASKVVAKKKNYPQEMLSGKAPLSAAQQWFFEHIQTDPFHFNQSFFLSSAKRLDAHLLRQSLEALARQHDVLRATYSKEEGLPVQTVGKGINISFQLVAIERGEQEDAVIACHTEKAQAGFNLEKGPLLKAVLFQKKSGDELLLTIHHLVVDGVSWRILIEDLTTAYSQLEAGETIRLAPKTAPFAWWAEKAHAHANSPACLAHLDYWEQQLARPVDTIIAGHPDRPNKVGVSASVQFQLDKKQTQFLLQQTHQAYHTEINDILLCALSRALQQVFGGRTYQITLEGHGRETLFDMDVSRAVGWFTSMFPVVLTYEEELGYHLLSTKENLHRIPNKGMDYALLRYLSEQSFSQKENSAISFNYLGAFSNGPADALLTFSGRDTGPSISPAINRDKELDVLGILLDGKLQISITYSHQRMEKAKMDALAEAFEKELLQLMAHCMEQKAGQLSPADFTACDLSLEQYYDFLSANQLLADEIEDIYTLSPMQEGMLFHKLLNPGSPAYFNQLVLHLSATALDIPHFQYCWRQILKAHPVLRTSFFSEGLPSPLQVVHKEAGLSFVNRDISNFSPGKQEQILTTYLATDRGKGFSLKEKSLLRVALFQTGIAQFRLVISGHHITIDGWSLAILLQDLQLMYQNNGHFLQLKPYSPYIAWLREQPESESEAFWKEYLEGYEETAGIPGMQRTTPSAPIEPGSELLVLSSEQTAALEQLAKSHQVSLNTIVQGVWAVILGVYNQKEEVVFGITTSGRAAPVENIEQMSGLFINTIPIRIALPVGQSFSQLLRSIQQSALAVQEFEHYSLALIQSSWQGQGELIDHILVFENYPIEKSEVEPEEGVTITDTKSYESFHYGFGLVAGPGKELNLQLNYNKAVLATQWVKRIKSHIITTIDAILAQPEQSISQINVLPQAERQLLLYDYNNTKADFPSGKTIIDLFEEQVEKAPDNIAVVFEDRQLTYRDLNKKANQVGHYLRTTYQIQADDIIALQLERSEWMIVAILGVMKAGAAYLPIDPDFPKNRVEYILHDSRAKVLLTDESTYSSARELNAILAVLSVEKITNRKKGKPVSINNSKNLAYVIYTSGSTGRPKGVMIEHQALVNFLWSMKKTPGIEERDVLLSITNYTFDISILEIGLPLITGARIVLASSNQQNNPDLLQTLIEKTKPTLFQATPSLWSILIDNRIEGLKNMKLLCGGEALSEHLATKLMNSGKEIWNMYGPTETTIWSSVLKLEANQRISIGKPIGNTCMYVLSSDLAVLPPGITGELYIGGAGLARGYLNNPELTAEKFIPHPFREGERLYKTGDLARWLPDGNIEFLGRIDHQLKIRGHRIEAGEIEQALLQHPAIQSAVVVGEEMEQSKELVAYLVVEGQVPPNIESLRRYLSKQLPNYMIPAYFVELEELPLTTSGKINRKALSRGAGTGSGPNGHSLASGVIFVAPRTATETTLADIWKAILKRTDIGIYDDFFGLGGNSLRSIRMVALIQQKLDAKVALDEVFAHPTIIELAEIVAQKEKMALMPIPRIE